MNTPPQSGSRRRLLVALPAIALAATSLTVTGSAAAQTSGPARATIGADEYYINYAEPAVQPDTDGKEVKGEGGVYASPVDEARAYDRKYAGGNPVTARELAKLEAKAIKTGQEPAPDQAGQEHPDRQAADPAGRVQRHRPTTTSPARWCRRRSSRTAPACPAPSRTARCTTTSRTRRRCRTRTTTRCGCRTSRPTHYNKMLYTKRGHHRAGPHRPDRAGRQAGHRPRRPHHAQHVPGDVQGRVHGRRAGQPVDHRAALGGLVRAPPAASRTRTATGSPAVSSR